MIRSVITDPATKRQAEVVNRDEKNALVVATRPLKTYENSLNFFVNSEYGSELAIDASAGGTPVEIHNGIDDVLWTASDIVGGGKTTFDSSDQNHTSGGSQSIKVDNSPVGDMFQILNSSAVDLNNYVSLTIWVYIDKDWKNGDTIEVFGYDTNLGIVVGNAIDLSSYLNINDQDTWQRASIPLDDMGLSDTTTLDALRVQIVTKEGKSPKFYLDDIQFEQTGTPQEYVVEPAAGTWLHVDKLMIVYADAYAGTVEDGTMPSIPYDSFFGLSKLSSGVLYQRKKANNIVTSFPIKQHLDMMSFSNGLVTGSGSDGTNSWVSVSINFPSAIILKHEDRDNISLTISEDLSSLLTFKVSAGGFEEFRK